MLVNEDFVCDVDFLPYRSFRLAAGKYFHFSNNMEMSFNYRVISFGRNSEAVDKVYENTLSTKILLGK